YVPYQTHAMMEPPVALAIPEADSKMTIHAPTQNPQGARAVVAQYLGMKETDIIVRPSLIGSAYGRKGMHDFICEAAFLAKAIAAPVKVQWTRTDDMRHDFYHPMSAQRLEGGVDKNGTLVAWRHRTAFPSIASTFKSDATTPDAAQLGEGFVDFPYLV